MRFLVALLPVTLAFFSAHAFPMTQKSRRDIPIIDDAIVFDAAAFEDPANPGSIIAGLQSFVFLHQIDLGPLTSGISSALSALGLDVGDKLSTLQSRIKLFASVGLSGTELTIDVGGCSKTATLPPTSGLPDPGMALNNVSIGQCGNTKELSANLEVSPTDSRQFNATVFMTPPDGFGVISDIDDTVKISNVLDKVKLVQSTFLDDPQPVAGMPELYASLAQSLNSPQFIYVSGSPFQLYPFLNDFIHTTYSASAGPILLQNLSFVDVPSLLNFAQANGILEYKLSMIDRIKGMYPKKKFLAIGDSTQKDPETYGEAFRKYGDSIACSWIRVVDGADNTQARFSAAFDGVPTDKFRLYTDADIPGLANIDVAGGEC